MSSRCPSCGTEVESDAVFCPECGTDLSSEGPGDEGDKQSTSDSHKRFQDDERSVTEVVKEDEIKEYIKYIVGIFLSVGLGYSLALLLFDLFVDSGVGTGGEFILFGLLLAILITPVLASFAGITIGLQLEDSEKAVASAAGVGSLAGFAVMIVLTIIVASIISDGGSGGADDLITEELLSIIGFGLGVAAAGGLSGIVTKRLLFKK